MEPSFPFGQLPSPPIHHHHHHHHAPLCHHHRHRHHLHQFCPQHSHHHHHHHHFCHFHLHRPYAPLQSPEPVPSYNPLQDSLNTVNNKETADFNSQVSEDAENEGLEEEDDEDPIFVLTDEWREFFARSEAKRRLEKQKAKKKREEVDDHGVGYYSVKQKQS